MNESGIKGNKKKCISIIFAGCSTAFKSFVKSKEGSNPDGIPDYWN